MSIPTNEGGEEKKTTSIRKELLSIPPTPIPKYLSSKQYTHSQLFWTNFGLILIIHIQKVLQIHIQKVLQIYEYFCFWRILLRKKWKFNGN